MLVSVIVCVRSIEAADVTYSITVNETNLKLRCIIPFSNENHIQATLKPGTIQNQLIAVN